MNTEAVLDIPQTSQKKLSHVKPGNPSGVSKTALSLKDFLTKDFTEQRKEVDQRWMELAYTLPSRAVHFSLRAGKKEFGALQQLVTAAAIAKDKRFPNDDSALTIRIPSRLFNTASVAMVIRSTPNENPARVKHAEPIS